MFKEVNSQSLSFLQLLAYITLFMFQWNPVYLVEGNFTRPSEEHIYNYTVAYTSTAFENYDKILIAAMSLSKDILPKDFILNLNLRDNVGNLAISNRNFEEAVLNDKSVTVMGPAYSVLAASCAAEAEWFSYPLVSPATNNDFSKKKLYPTFVRFNNPDAQQAHIHSTAIRRLGFSRVGLLVEEAGIEYAREIKRIEKQYGLSVPSTFLFDFEIERDDEYSLGKVRDMLTQMKNSQIKAFGILFTLGGSNDRLRILFEEAHKMGMVGSSTFSFIVLASQQFHTFFDNWAYVQDHPEAAVGILATQYKCDVDSPYYTALDQEFGVGSYPTELQCLLFDNHLLALRALNRTIAYLDSQSIHRRCLEYAFYFDPENENICQHSNQIIYDKISIEGKCDAQNHNVDCVHCGVCELLGFFDDGPTTFKPHYIQALMLNSYYSIHDQGSYGLLRLDKNGDRTLQGQQVFFSSSVPVYDANQSQIVDFRFRDVYKLTIAVSNSQIDHKASQLKQLGPRGLNYAGGSLETLNYEKPSELPEVQFLVISPYLRLFIVITTGVLIGVCVISAILVFHFRKSLVMKTTSPGMSYMILLGVSLSFGSVMVLNLYTLPVNEICITTLWLRHIGWAFVFGPILAKTYRMNRIFNIKNKGVTNQRKSERNLLIAQIIFLLAVVIYLVVFTIICPPHAQVKVLSYYTESGDGPVKEVSVFCNSSSTFTYVLLMAEFLCLFYGALVAFSTRKLPSFYNDFRIIGWAIYSWVFVTVVEVTLNLVSDYDVTVYYVIFSICVIWPFVVVLLCFYGVKFFKIYFQGKDDIHEDDFAGQQNRGVCGRCGQTKQTISGTGDATFTQQPTTQRPEVALSTSIDDDLSTKISDDYL